jgi:threonine/homoserine/homoserine lactone efflux protein
VVTVSWGWSAVIGFALAVLPICLTPGTSFALVTSRVLARGRRGGALVAAGTACGIVCHATLAGLGLAAAVMHSSVAFTVVKLVGAGYLIGLGLVIVYRSRSSGRGSRAASAQPGRRLPWTGRGDFVQGLLGNVLNPKAAAVYLTLAPQFLPATPTSETVLLGQMLVLATAHVVVAVGWLLCWTAVVGRARAVVRSPRFRQVIDRVTGSVLILLGIRTAAAT